MPQMMPLNWLILFLYFIIILIMISIINYYIILYTPTLVLKNNFFNKSMTLNWLQFYSEYLIDLLKFLIFL